ncbi:MAG: transcriptional regulator NrdR [Lentisphaeraceae bacterium]|nr:transcriptional regulator NrdR [Lentisphaeraceae bacterium]
MLCPDCGCTEDKVLETRVSKNKDIIRRRRECTQCSTRFNTQEELIRTDFVVIKSDDRREDLNLQKIRNGLEISCRKRPVTSKQIDKAMQNIKLSIEKNFDREVPSKEIGVLVMENLKAIDEVAYVRFASVYRNFKDAAEFIKEIQDLYNQ